MNDHPVILIQQIHDLLNILWLDALQQQNSIFFIESFDIKLFLPILRLNGQGHHHQSAVCPPVARTSKTPCENVK